MTGTTPLERAMALLDELQAKVEELERAKREPIAVIGMGCRYPGAENPEQFWKNLRAGVDSIGEIPRSRWNLDDYYDGDADVPGKMYTRHGGFLESVDRFDAPFFRISPREAAGMDPQQRLLLEVAWEALEDAGMAIPRPTPTGVFIGITNNDYLKMQSRLDDTAVDSWYASNSLMNVAAGRISYLFGLQGPSMAVDTACSSSLSATHLACRSLRAGECNVALAGGVSLILSPELNIHLSKARMMAVDGRCKTFDARADGYVRGEGCGVVVLQRLSDAVREGNRILAVIRGSAINNGGHSSGLTVPNGLAQQEVIRMALDDAGMDAHRVGYLEAHGTGTPLGDPIEFRALAAVLCRGREAAARLAVGSVKTNIGHTEAAAGVAGLIKVIQSLRHEEIPAHLHFRTMNPDIALGGYAAYVPTERVAWPRTRQARVAGVSSFGFSGTNAHVVVEEAPAAVEAAGGGERPVHVLAISARSEAALGELAARYADRLRGHAAEAADICYSANTGRTAMAHRLSVTGASAAELAAKLGERPGAGGAAGDTRPVFLFTGQGSQYAGMARGLFDTEAAFRAALEQCDRLLRKELKEPLLDVMWGRASQAEAIHETEYTQPAIFALEWSLAELWRSWGVEPSAVMGHSVGEYVAACVAGVFTLEEGLSLVAERARMMQALARDGEMRVFLAPEARMAEAISAVRDRVAIAAVNGPDHVVVSGDANTVRAIAAELERQGVTSRAVKVSHAFHSPLMEPMMAAFERRASRVAFQAPKIRLISNVTGDFVKDGEVASAGYWTRHLRETVRFSAGIERLKDAGFGVFVELGPHPTLTEMAKRCVPEGYGTFVASLRRGAGDLEQTLESLAQAWMRGVNVDWASFDRAWPRRKVALPSYPFQRESYWLETGRPRSGSPAHPILGTELQTALEERVYENRFSRTSPGLLDDHRIHGVMVVPGSCYLSMAISAGVTRAGDVMFQRALLLGDDEVRPVQLIRRPGGEFRIFSMQPDGAWTLHASGQADAAALGQADHESVARIQERCVEQLAGEDFYGEYRRYGYDLGPAFQWMDAIWRRDGEALCRMTYAHAKGRVNDGLQPGLIDSCLQLLCHSLPSGGVGGFVKDGQVYIPLSIESFECSGAQAAEMWCHARLTGGDAADSHVFTGDFRLFGAGGETLAQARGVRLIRAEKKALFPATGRKAELLWRVRWEEQAAAGSTGEGWFELAGDVDAAGAEMLRRGRGECRGVVYFAGKDDALRSCREVLELLQAGRKVWVVTRGAQAVEGSEVSPEQAALWGLGRVAAAEHPELWGGLIDLDPRGGSAELARELLGADGEDQVAWRDGRRYVARLAPLGARGGGRLELRPDATYVITGGRGALGSKVAELLARRGARNLVLVGRGEGEVSLAGVRVVNVRADVANRGEMEAVFASIRATLPEVRGIVHAAGVTDDALLMGQTGERLATVFAPKVAGSWNLNELSREMALDFFVLFSSFASLMGLPGQANYAAANAYLDGLAHYRRGLGLPALAINWGPWGEVGMAARSGSQRMETIAPEDGLEILEWLMASGETQAAAMPGVSTSWREVHPRGSTAPLLAGLAASVAVEVAGSFDAAAVLAADDGERGRLVEEAIAGATSRTLSMAAAKIDRNAPLSDYGLDSLIAFSLINRIKAEMGITLPIQKFLGGASIRQLAHDALQELLISSLSARREEAETSDWEAVEL
ncbi:MAG TPA: type I polyketide synthase [Candidatus Sulfopaludibacter sp.]|jgi:acyl transferase domain-containing protein|nr:type I polyketide synthase [Candidatus Sulfopaludibacter sp.]